MSAFLSLLLGLPAALACLLALFLLVEVVAGLRPRRSLLVHDTPGPFCIVVPAHDEEAVIGETLACLMPSLRPCDRLLVVADNCSDATAAIARERGAEVTERRHDTERGKGYALQHAVDMLRLEPPQTVVFIDADCTAAPGAITALAAAAGQTGRPVQALYLMEGGGESPKARVSRFAWLLMNKLRMRGLSRLSGHCRLVGTGMAMPFGLAGGLNLASGEIVEDIALALDLAAAGHAPLFLEQAVVSSTFPESGKAVTTQRARWEIGALRLARKTALPLFVKSLARGALGPALLALDIVVPPLVVFAAAILGLFAFTFLGAFLGAPVPLILSAAALLSFGTAVMLAWVAEGRKVLPLSMAGGIIAFAAAKAGIYGGEGRRSAAKWTRTDRH